MMTEHAVSKWNFGLDPRLEIRAIPGMGRGVFATASLKEGESLGAFCTIHIPSAEVASMAGGTLSHYWFEDDADGAAFIVLGFIELINHSIRPNMDRRWAKTELGDVVELYCLRAIAAGEQLLIDYRFEGKPADPPWARQ